MMKKINIAITVFIVALTSCKRFVEIDFPVDKSTENQVFDDVTYSVAAMSNVYAQLCNMEPYGGGAAFFTNSLQINSGFLADELKDVGNQKRSVYQNDVAGTIGEFNLWSISYRQVLFRINSVIEGVAASSVLPAKIRKTLTAEAKFTRALIYFYLTNFYGDVPLVLTTNLDENSQVVRSSQSNVYTQIISDLKYAQENLETHYLANNLITYTDDDRVRPNKAAATALLARAYLYTSQWDLAEKESTKIINDVELFELMPLNEVFLKGSKEAIWQLQPNVRASDGTNVPEAKTHLSPFIIMGAISLQLLEAFEAADLRRVDWITDKTIAGKTYQVPYKYKIGGGDSNQDQVEYTMVLRLSEQYLIRAESRAHLNNILGDNSAASDLYSVRERAGLGFPVAENKDEMIEAILLERQRELFLEWGHRWLDLKRTGKINSVMEKVTPLKGGRWSAYKALMPIPFEDIRYNLSLRGHQNPGYPEL